ncbi:MBL fold metallo-hydrolase [Gracilimonas mengyeensis]|uniref:Metallo-beta-lactamase superfamily protein n=1 Tax=Gracilimonas mengyeensis TaxID=1302730 RepID=A0A521FIY7_9BACT|nr:MBL fold metallo-hydrolase [Gracilimonas mengyeensis]SMO96115.1 Metallo-beta-lactamase superfamily protein [Gracilimonas mengyeensis]
MKTYAAVLYEGTFSVGTDKKFVRIDRDDPPAKGALKLSLNPFLIHTEERNYLFDCGIGEFGEDTGPDTILGNLEEHGLNEFDITDIFLSHLHYDHIGGLAHRQNGYWELTFPDAKIWVSKKAWGKVTSKDEFYDEEKTEFIHFLDAKADLHFLGEEEQPYPEITVRQIGGHTEFHQVLLFDDGDKKYMQAGDVIGTKGAVNRKYAAKYDFEPKVSQQQREELTKLAYDEGFTLMCYHEDRHPLFKLTNYDEKTGYSTEKIESHVPA